MEFKREFDANLPVSKMLPSLYKEDPILYKKMSIQELSSGIHSVHKKYNLSKVLDKAYDILPKQKMTPYQAYQEFIKGNVEECKLEDLKGKICAEMILPYPPGIPLLFPGECVEDEEQAILDYLFTLCDIGKKFTGFATDIHGTWQMDDGTYYVKVVKG
jgi:lysine decarboxylase